MHDYESSQFNVLTLPELVLLEFRSSPLILWKNFFVLFAKSFGIIISFIINDS